MEEVDAAVAFPKPSVHFPEPSLLQRDAEFFPTCKLRFQEETSQTPLEPDITDELFLTSKRRWQSLYRGNTNC